MNTSLTETVLDLNIITRENQLSLFLSHCTAVCHFYLVMFVYRQDCAQHDVTVDDVMINETVFVQFDCIIFIDLASATLGGAAVRASL
jgi:hypothetical protein